MNLTSNKNIVIFCLAMISIFAIVFCHSNLQLPAQQTQTSSQPPLSFIKKASIYQFNKTGTLKSVLIVNRLTLTDKNHYIAIKPKLTLYNERNGAWTIQSNHSITNNLTNTTELVGDVSINETPPSGSPTKLKTQSLTLYQTPRIAKTIKQVSVTEGNSMITAQGLYANLNTGILKLLNNSRGNYEIPPH